MADEWAEIDRAFLAAEFVTCARCGKLNYLEWMPKGSTICGLCVCHDKEAAMDRQRRKDLIERGLVILLLVLLIILRLKGVI